MIQTADNIHYIFKYNLDNEEMKLVNKWYLPTASIGQRINMKKRDMLRTNAESQSPSLWNIVNISPTQFRVMYSLDAGESWSSFDQKTSILRPNQTLLSGETIYSSNKNYSLIMQADGNFCVRDKNNLNIWCFTGNPKDIVSGSSLHMQADGNLCVYDAENIVVWCLNQITTITPNSYLQINNVVVWCSKSNPPQ